MVEDKRSDRAAADSPAKEAADAPAEQPGDAPVDAARRQFFRTFGREAIHAAASVVGAAGAIRRGSAAATDLLRVGRDASEAVMAGAPGEAPSGFRSPYRVAGDTLYLLDQNALPASVEEIACVGAGAVALEMRRFSVRGAPVLGQVAAYALAIAASEVRAQPPRRREAALRGAATALRLARPSVADVQAAVSRLEARVASLGDAPGDVVADALRLEADTVAGEALLGHARLGRAGVDVLPFPADRPLEICTIGNYGPLAGGMVGTALGIVLAAHADGRQLHVWVGETRPLLEGSRLTALELARASIDHTIVADGALPGLIAAGRVDVVLLGAERVAANGDVCGVVGTYGLAAVAARHGVPVLVAVPASTLDLARASADELPLETRPADDLRRPWGAPLANPTSPAHNPLVDLTPAELVVAFVTDEGVVRAPFGPALARVATDAAARRVPVPLPDARPAAEAIV